MTVLKEIDALQAAEADTALNDSLEAEIAALRHVNGNGPVKTVPPARAGRRRRRQLLPAVRHKGAQRRQVLRHLRGSSGLSSTQ